MLFSAGISVLGAALTFLLPETAGRGLGEAERVIAAASSDLQKDPTTHADTRAPRHSPGRPSGDGRASRILPRQKTSSVHPAATHWEGREPRLHRGQPETATEGPDMNTASHRRTILALGTAATAAAALACSAAPALAAPSSPAPAGSGSGYTVKAFHAVGSETTPDDIARLGESIYVAYQNGIGPMGEPSPTGATASTIQQYSLDGTPGASWDVTGHVDGLGADPAAQRLLVTTNEDGNSSFHTLDPGAGANAVKDYSYTGLTHGGGTDSVLVYQGKILISASNPSTSTGPAVYEASLSGSTAALTPVFADDATATFADGAQAGTSAPLALTDPDSSTIVPAASPRFRNDFLLDSQGDQQLVFAARAGTPQQSLHVLDLPQPVNDTAFATAADHSLLITDPSHDTVYSVTGAFHSGEAITAVTPNSGPDYLAALNLSDGSLTPIPQLSAIHPEGLLFTGAR